MTAEFWLQKFEPMNVRKIYPPVAIIILPVPV